MKKLIGILLVFLIGCVLGYVFHEPIDTKLKARFGDEKTEAFKAKVEDVGEKTVDVSKAMVDAGKEELDTAKTE